MQNETELALLEELSAEAKCISVQLNRRNDTQSTVQVERGRDTVRVSISAPADVDHLAALARALQAARRSLTTRGALQ